MKLVSGVMAGGEKEKEKVKKTEEYFSLGDDEVERQAALVRKLRAKFRKTKSSGSDKRSGEELSSDEEKRRSRLDKRRKREEEILRDQSLSSVSGVGSRDQSVVRGRLGMPKSVPEVVSPMDMSEAAHVEVDVVVVAPTGKVPEVETGRGGGGGGVGGTGSSGLRPVSEIVEESRTVSGSLTELLASSKITVSMRATLISIMSKLTSGLGDLVRHNDQLLGRIQELERGVSAGSRADSQAHKPEVVVASGTGTGGIGLKKGQKVSYASVVGSGGVGNAASFGVPPGAVGINGVRRPTPGKATSGPVAAVPSYSVIVRGAGDTALSGDVVKQKVMALSSGLADVRVKAIRRLHDGVAIETCSAGELKRLTECAALASAGLAVSAPRVPGYRMCLKGVLATIPTEELMRQLFEKNATTVVTSLEFEKEVRLIWRPLKTYDEGLHNVTVEVSARICDHWVSQGYVYVGWGRHPVWQLSSVNLCHRCHGYGHFARECKEASQLCRRCGTPGHLEQACLERFASCRNCRKGGKPDKHAVNSTKCPLFGSALVRIIERRNPYHE